MRYLKCSFVDSVTGVPVSEDSPARNGQDLPRVDKITFGFALESEYPTLEPTIFCVAPDSANVEVPGVLEELSEVVYDEMHAAELDARKALSMHHSIDSVSARRFQAEVAGFQWNGFFIDRQRDSQGKINIQWAAARDGFRADGSVWKCFDLALGRSVSRPTSNEEMIQIGQKSFQYGQACYDREGELLSAIADATYTVDMLESGWPAQQ